MRKQQMRVVAPALIALTLIALAGCGKDEGERVSNATASPPPQAAPATPRQAQFQAERMSGAAADAQRRAAAMPPKQ